MVLLRSMHGARHMIKTSTEAAAMAIPEDLTTAADFTLGHDFLYAFGKSSI